MHGRTRQRRAQAGAAGFTMVEMAVTLLLTSVILTVLYSTLITSRKVAFDQGQRSDVLGSLRSGYEFLSRDLADAGYHLINNQKLGTFGTVFANTDASDAVTTNAVTIWTNPGTAEAALVQVMDADDSDLVVDDVTGFVPGMPVWIVGTCIDGVVHRDRFVVSSVDAAAPFKIYHATPENASASLTCRYRTGAKVVRIRQVTYQLSVPVNGLSNLTRTEDEGTAVVIASGITSLNFTYWNGADPAVGLNPNTSAIRRSIRRLKITLVGRTAERMRVTNKLQTQTVSGDVAPRNLVLQDYL